MKKDKPLIFFGVVAACCLVVSVPATATAMELFHGTAWGLVATIVFEVGAVGAELSTLAIPQWRKRLSALTVSLLVATTGANYALGVDAFVSATLPATYAGVRAEGYGWLLAVVASALFPALLFVFLTAFTARYRMVRGGYDTPVRLAALWMNTLGYALSTRLNTSEQRVNSLEQDVRAYEQRLEQEGWAREQAEQSAVNAVSRLEAMLKDREQELSGMRADLAARDRQVNELLFELNSRPAPVEVEVVKVARAQLTLEQMADLFGTSVSTVRRRLTTIEAGEVTQ